MKTRRVAGIDTLILQETSQGTFAVARDWTDQADPFIYTVLEIKAPILDVQSLLVLLDVVEQIKGQTKEKKGK